MEHPQFVLHPKQMEAIRLTKRHPVVKYVGGIRGGKSITGSHFALENLYNRPDELGSIFAPTHRVLTQMTLKEFKKVLAANGIYQDVHYVVGKRPEPIFGYRSRFPEDHNGVWSFCHGQQIYTFSLESFYRGAEFGWSWGDEIQDATKDDLDTVLGRMSGSKRGAVTLYTYTPPSDNPDVDELTWGEKALPGVFGTTYDNEKNLPVGYIDMLRNTMAPLTFAREVMCERKPMSGLNWMYTFSRSKHVSAKAAYNPKDIVYLSFDFNVSPFTCVMSHRGRHPNQQFGYIHYFGEVALDPDNVGDDTYFSAMRTAIELKCPFQFQHRLFIVTGDASGRNSSIHARVGTNNWTELMAALGISKTQLQVGAANDNLKDSRALCNAIFANYDEVLVNPECYNTIRDLEFVKGKPDGTIAKDNRDNVLQRADLLDCIRYDLAAFNRDFIKR